MKELTAMVLGVWLAALLVEMYCVYRRIPAYERYGIVLYAAPTSEAGYRKRIFALSEKLLFSRHALSFHRLDKCTLAFFWPSLASLLLRGIVRFSAENDSAAVRGYLPYSFFIPMLLVDAHPWIVGGYLTMYLIVAFFFVRRLDELTYKLLA